MLPAQDRLPEGGLGKENAEDNLMRVVSKDIAAELMEITFGVSETGKI